MTISCLFCVQKVSYRTTHDQEADVAHHDDITSCFILSTWVKYIEPY